MTSGTREVGHVPETAGLNRRGQAIVRVTQKVIMPINRERLIGT